MTVASNDRGREAESLIRMAESLGQIARGRSDNGRPLAAENARQIARNVLIELDLTWPKVQPPRIKVKTALDASEQFILSAMISEPGGEISWTFVFKKLGERVATGRLNCLRSLGLIEHPGYNRWKITEKGRIAFALQTACRTPALSS
ncbi:hypothetical protein, partial [Tardiphaga sp.]|uniref:hypothetical protein n=1 Tax=Tardiphaga sp. TaxID=1926292 RepID=UPI0037DA5E42